MVIRNLEAFGEQAHQLGLLMGFHPGTQHSIAHCQLHLRRLHLLKMQSTHTQDRLFCGVGGSEAGAGGGQGGAYSHANLLFGKTDKPGDS